MKQVRSFQKKPPKLLINKEYDEFALSIIKKLNDANFNAYLVGGCIRDNIVGIAVKDFDIATDATPEQIRKLFKASRIIGKRFKLVHVYKKNKVIEVSTFRSESANTENNQQIVKDASGKILRDNVWGSINDDCHRRDFTINAIYFNPISHELFDKHNGISDIYDKRIVSIGDPLLRFEEDPVRSLRAIRFASKLGFKIENKLKDAIYQKGHLLTHVSNARRFDEFNKIFLTGNGYKNFCKLKSFGILKYLVHPNQSEFGTLLEEHALKNTDSRVKEKKSVTPGFLLSALLWPRVIERSKIKNKVVFKKFNSAMGLILNEQLSLTAIPRSFHTYIKDIWKLQFKLERRTKFEPFKVLQHPRFRAAYDLLLLRESASSDDSDIGKWWTKFQSSSRKTKILMLDDLKKNKSEVKKFGFSGELG